MALARHSWRLIGLVGVCVISTAMAQEYPPGSLTAENAAVNRTLVSPEVLPDRKVVFRIYAPRASEVLVAGDWLQPPPPIPLAKNEQGVWSTTVGPLAPDYYLYWFRVDGVMTRDPKNFDGILFIPGADTQFMENGAVPHGELRHVWYRSSVLNVQRSMHVYTPPGYETTDTRVPALYLLQGAGALDSSWSGVGRTGLIMDNLLASQKATAMLVVMPQLSLPPARARFGEELLKDIIPYVEKHYRVRRERDRKALAGFSIGGYQTLEMLTRHPETFAYYAVWSAPVEPKTVAAFRQEQTQFLTDAAKLNNLVKRLWFRIGSEDIGAPHVQNLSTLLREHGVKHDLRMSGGGHRWQNWRRYLHEYAQEIFR